MSLVVVWQVAAGDLLISYGLSTWLSIRLASRAMPSKKLDCWLVSLLACLLACLLGCWLMAGLHRLAFDWLPCLLACLLACLVAGWQSIFWMVLIDWLLVSHWNESTERAHHDSRKVVVEIPYPLRSDNLLTCLMSLIWAFIAIVAINSWLSEQPDNSYQEGIALQVVTAGDTGNCLLQSVAHCFVDWSSLLIDCSVLILIKSRLIWCVKLMNWLFGVIQTINPFCHFINQVVM